ncbi:hypothetical protein K1719_000692 [Acacia pycnantha]|nr:hypothetical protein K1719_000692 [Acacia pycnantha]
MWEMNPRKLMVEFETSTTEFSDQSKNLANVGRELSAAHAECDNLKIEIEQLKLSLEHALENQKVIEVSNSQGEYVPEIERPLQDELEFHKDSNANSSL